MRSLAIDGFLGRGVERVIIFLGRRTTDDAFIHTQTSYPNKIQ